MIDFQRLGLVFMTSPFLCCQPVSIIDRQQLPQIELNGQTFVHIPAHTFQMGRSGKGVPLDEQPPHSVLVEDFYIATTEVTNHQLSIFLNQSKMSHFSIPSLIGIKGTSTRPTQIINTGKRYRAALGWENHPASTVSFDAATEYCGWLGGRLPTEVEWEAAARAGEEAPYPWSSESTNNQKEQANTNRTWSGYMPTMPVGQYESNAFGLFDVIGNVWEWTNSFYKPYTQNLDNDEKRRVLRGGDWFIQLEQISIYAR